MDGKENGPSGKRPHPDGKGNQTIEPGQSKMETKIQQTKAANQTKQAIEGQAMRPPSRSET